MHRILPLLALGLIGLAGCVEDAPQIQNETPETPLPPQLAELPKDIKESKMVAAGIDPFNLQGLQPICSTPASTCFKYPFTIAANQIDANTSIDFTAELNWGIDANDFDLYLYKDGAQVAADGAAPPGKHEELAAEITETGKYELIVVAWAAVGDTYTVEGKFVR